MPLKQLSGWVVSSVVTVVNLYEIHFLRIRYLTFGGIRETFRTHKYE